MDSIRKAFSGMIRVFFIASVASTGVCLMSSFACAHPPQYVRISSNGFEITAVVTHVVSAGVSDTSKHFLSRIQIYVNDNKVHEENFSNQKSNSRLVSYKYKDLKRGDTIKVIAYCSEYGQLEKQYLVEQDPAKQVAAAEQAEQAGQKQNTPQQQGTPSVPAQSGAGPMTEVQTEQSGAANEPGESAEAQAYFQESGPKEYNISDK